jgi:outer membrane usher protein
LRLAIAITLALLCAPALAGVPADADPLVLDVSLNANHPKEGSTFWKVGDALANEPGEWTRLGVVLTPEEGAAKVLTTRELGITFKINEAAGVVDLTLPPSRMPAQVLNASGIPKATLAPIAPGVMVNYDLQAAVSRKSQGVSLGHEVRVGTKAGIFVTQGQANLGAGEGAEYRRGRTYFQRDNEAKMLSYQVGDVSAGGTGIGGVRVAYDPRGLDPTRPLYATPTLGGISLDQGTLEILSGKARISERPIEKGAFTIERAPLRSGRNALDYVLRDRFGREILLGSQSVYFAPSLLAKGQREWEVSAGKVREGLTNNYGAAAFAASGRYGLSDAWTIGGSVQATQDARNAGVSLDTVLGNAGTLSLEAAASTGLQGNGTKWAARYAYSGPRVNFAISRQEQKNFWNLGAEDPMALQASKSTSASLGLRFPERRLGVRALYLDQTAYGQRTQFLDLSASWSGKGANISGGAIYNFQAHDTTLALTYRQQLGRSFQLSAGVRQAPDVTEARLGLEGRFNTGAGRALVGVEARGDDRGARSLSARGNLFTSKGVARATVDYNDGEISASGGFSGAAYFGEGGMQFLPRVDSYAVVKIPGIAGVPIKLNNRIVGKTNMKGVAVIGPLPALAETQISLVDKELPIGVQIEETEQWVAAKRQAGALVVFPVTSMEAWTFQVQKGGKDVEAGSASKSDSEEGQVGFGGELFLQKAKPGQAITIETKSGACTITLPEVLPTLAEMPALECK